MKTGFTGTFIISWAQTELDGLRGAAQDALVVGAVWSWTGDLVQVDGPSGILRLDQAIGVRELRQRAAQKVRKLVGRALDGTGDGIDTWNHLEENTPEDIAFVVTDGTHSYPITIIETGQSRQALLMFHGSVPPRERDLWIVNRSLPALPNGPQKLDPAGMICFTQGTQIATPHGAVPIETLNIGDKVHTKDNGTQQIEWIGTHRMTGARLFAMPHLRPICIHANAFDSNVPDEKLLVSPDHRLLIQGPVARNLFNTSEVLVMARDLIDGHKITVDVHARFVTYVHIMLEQHSVVWANGIETESFHPANTALSALAENDRAQLLSQKPEFATDPHLYGAYARRNLSPSEAAILRYAA